MTSAVENSVPNKKKSSVRIDIESIGIRMVVAGVPFAIAARVVALAVDDGGSRSIDHRPGRAESLLRRWDEAEPDGRAEIVEEMRVAVDAPRGWSGDVPVEVVRARLRDLIAGRGRAGSGAGGVVAVAKKAGMAPSSLSRLLTGTATPRAATLDKLCKALGIDRETLLRMP